MICEYCGGTRRDKSNPKRCYGCGHEAATPAQTVSDHPFLTPNQHALYLSYQAQLQNMNPPYQSALGPLMVRRDGIADRWLSRQR